MGSISISFIIPCLNEEKNIGQTIDKCQAELIKNKVFDYEIIVIDNNSTDKSSSIAKRKGAKVILEKERGYGRAIRTGLINASKEICIIIDADMTYDPSSINKMIFEHAANNVDIVIGNRWGVGIEKGAMPFLHKYLGNPSLSFIGRYLFNSKISDFHCGLRSIKTNVARSLPFTVSGMEFATEMIALGSIFKLKFAQVSTSLFKPDKDRVPHLKTWSDGWRHLSYMVSMSPKKSFLYLGIFLETISIILLMRFFSSNNYNSLLGGINSFIISYLLSLISIILLKEYLENKFILEIKLNHKRNIKKINHYKRFKIISKFSLFLFLFTLISLPITYSVILILGFTLQIKIVYLITYLITCLCFLNFLMILLSFRLHLLKI